MRCIPCGGTGTKGEDCPMCGGNGWLPDPTDGGTMRCDFCDDVGWLPPDV
jgi:hypothetical protein